MPCRPEGLDGTRDLVVARSTEPVLYLRHGLGGLVFAGEQVIGTATAPSVLIARDLDRDGAEDLLVLGPGGAFVHRAVTSAGGPSSSRTAP